MKSKAEIQEKIFVYEMELEKHKANPDNYEKYFTELIEQLKGLLEWVIK